MYRFYILLPFVISIIFVRDNILLVQVIYLLLFSILLLTKVYKNNTLGNNIIDISILILFLYFLTITILKQSNVSHNWSVLFLLYIYFRHIFFRYKNTYYNIENILFLIWASYILVNAFFIIIYKDYAGILGYQSFSAHLITMVSPFFITYYLYRYVVVNKYRYKYNYTIIILLLISYVITLPFILYSRTSLITLLVIYLSLILYLIDSTKYIRICTFAIFFLFISTFSYTLYNRNILSFSGRINIMIITLSDLSYVSLFGNGGESFSRLFPFIQAQYYSLNDSISRITADVATHPYNDLIHILFEYGLIGFVLLLFILVHILYITVYINIKSLKNIVCIYNEIDHRKYVPQRIRCYIISLGMTSSILCFVLLSLVNQPIRISNIQAVFALTLAWTVNEYYENNKIYK